MLASILGTHYIGWEIDAEKPLASQLEPIQDTDQEFVVKVDEAIKCRFKKGLVLLGVRHEDLASAVQELTAKGYRWLIIEPSVAHDGDAERYLSIALNRSSRTLKYSERGGVDIENNQDSITSVDLDTPETTSWDQLGSATGLGGGDFYETRTRF